MNRQQDETASRTGQVVTALYLCREKGVPRMDIEEGLFRTDHGLEGDCYSRPGDRQVTLLDARARRMTDEDTREGLCYARFRETLQLGGLSLKDLPAGTRIRAGEVLLEISAKGKRCFPECAILQTGVKCALAEGAAFARVLEGGRIRKGDPVEIL